MTTGESAMDRRRFLRLGGAVAAVTAAGAPVLLASDRALAVELTGAVDQHGADTLLAMLRRLYPHASLGDVYYLNVVADLDSEAAENGETKTLLAEGVKTLDDAMGVPFKTLSDGYQVKVLKRIEGEPFFEKVRGKAVVSLYNQKLVWRQLGYEGASFPKGGYIRRGFDDLAWLPDPPASASPPAHG
ncbi:hypothetical protein SAMN05216241_1101 [Limimonas halophila]|uniref:Tat (Twin-arginine translocation) pathway signal sequence n=1 Tax=Limimonas halophila TaxID=1082479 RepID=A0A1G7TMP4_9PROT|nr:hypothetical protein [Limimonas halophila]SDG36607.1 hypothetical protein SAMN05216241_1101 [Limimonas halophila]